MRKLSDSHGRTLTEVLFSIALIGATITVALPEMRQLLAASQLRSGMFALTDGLRLTRNEAIRRNGRVVMCKTADGLQCTKHGNWSQGWIVFHDPNNSGDVSAGEDILYREAPANHGLHISGNRTVDAYISYTSQGKAKQLGGGFQAGTLTVCRLSAKSTDAYQVVFGRPGRPRVQKAVVEQCG